jgi:hypothetical protein
MVFSCSGLPAGASGTAICASGAIPLASRRNPPRRTLFFVRSRQFAGRTRPPPPGPTPASSSAIVVTGTSANLTSPRPQKRPRIPTKPGFGFNQSTFGGFLFHRPALLRRISAGFTSGLPGPGSCDKRTITKTCALYLRSQQRSLAAHLVSHAATAQLTVNQAKSRGTTPLSRERCLPAAEQVLTGS